MIRFHRAMVEIFNFNFGRWLSGHPVVVLPKKSNPNLYASVVTFVKIVSLPYIYISNFNLRIHRLFSEIIFLFNGSSHIHISRNFHKPVIHNIIFQISSKTTLKSTLESASPLVVGVALLRYSQLLVSISNAHSFCAKSVIETVSGTLEKIKAE